MTIKLNVAPVSLLISHSSLNLGSELPDLAVPAEINGFGADVTGDDYLQIWV